MFFVLSKLLTYLLMPLGLCLALALAAFLVKNRRWKRVLAWAALVVFLVFSNKTLGTWLLRWHEPSPVALQSLQGPYDAAIVLGGVTKSRQPRDRVFLSEGADRLFHPLMLYKKGLVKKLVLSGGGAKLMGKKHARTEAERMAEVLRYAGVPQEAILLEKASRNTYENARNTAQLLQNQKPGGRYLLVTSAFHMPRARACFAKAGLRVAPFPVDFRAGPIRPRPESFLPSTQGLRTWSLLLHEWMGLGVYWLVGYV